MSDFWVNRRNQRWIEDVVSDAVLSRETDVIRFLDSNLLEGKPDNYDAEIQRHYKYLLEQWNNTKSLLDQIRGAIGE